MISRAVGALGALLLAVVSTPVAYAVEPPVVMIVFDGSGSMWGKAPGESNTKSSETKFSVAREAIKRTLPKLGRETRLGLAAFGHRRRGDCSDTEVLLPPEPVDAIRFNGPLDKFNPKGKGPLVQALRDAAASVSKAAGAATLVLIHDDPDNCNQDPCAVVEDLVRVHPKLTIHVIGIGLAKPDSQRMACVARATKGKHYDAQDVVSVGTAIEDALRLASLDVQAPLIATSPATIAAQKSAAAAPPLPDTGPPGLKSSATLGPGGPAVVMPLNWRVLRAGQMVAAQRSATLDLELAPGAYTVEVQQGMISTSQSVEVKARGATRIAMVLDAGAVKLSASLQRRAMPQESALFSISEVQASAGGMISGRTVWTGSADQSPVLLRPGTWKIVAEVDRAKVERQTVVMPGSMIDLILPLEAGRLRVRAVDGEGGASLERVLFRVTEDDPDAPDGRREVARSAAAAPEFTLPAGTYHLSAKFGQAEVRERVLVNAGDDVSRSLVLSLGRISLQSRLQPAGAPVGEAVSYRIQRLDNLQPGTRADVIKTSRPAPKLELAAGRYRVESWLGEQNSKVSREIDVKPGAAQTVTLDHAAASVQLRLSAGAARLMPGEVHWDIRDAGGRLVWQTALPEPRAFLSAGRYRISVDGRGRRTENVIDVRAGEQRVVEIAPE